MAKLFRLIPLALAACLSAPTAADTATGSGTTTKDPSQEVICQRTQRTGTRFQTRVCHTRETWNQIEEAAKRNARDLIDRPVIETRRDG